jgi:hypothetical protein
VSLIITDLADCKSCNLRPSKIDNLFKGTKSQPSQPIISNSTKFCDISFAYDCN